MGKFFSIPGMAVHQNSDDRPAELRDAVIYGDTPGKVSVPVTDPETGRVLYNRTVFDRGFTPGLDENDNISYHGDRLEKVADEYDARNARTTTTYRRFADNDGKYKGEVKVEHEQISEKGDNVIARTSRSGS